MKYYFTFPISRQIRVSGLLNHASLERLAYPDYSTFITERDLSVFVFRVFYQNNVTLGHPVAQTSADSTRAGFLAWSRNEHWGRVSKNLRTTRQMFSARAQEESAMMRTNST